MILLVSLGIRRFITVDLAIFMSKKDLERSGQEKGHEEMSPKRDKVT